jgi:hypothetical protein
MEWDGTRQWSGRRHLVCVFGRAVLVVAAWRDAMRVQCRLL